MFVFVPSVYPQRPGSQKRPRHRRQRDENRRLRSRPRRTQHRLLQEDNKRERYDKQHKELKR